MSELTESAKLWPDPAACTTSVRDLLARFSAQLPESVGLVPNLGQRLRVQPKVWQFWQSRTNNVLVEDGAERIRWSHIHAVKGAEFEAVVVAIPNVILGNTHVLDDWQDGTNSEQRRVLYVGVSRAKRVLIFVVPKSRRKQLEDILTVANVPYSVRTTS